MKKNNLLPFTGAIVLIVTLSLPFCKQAQKTESGPEDAKETALEYNKAKAIDKKESQFMTSAAEMSLKQIELAKLASANANKKELKVMADKIKTENEKFLEELKKLSADKNITIPTEITRDGAYDQEKLGKSEGNEFDENYCAALIEDHKEAIKKYKAASEDIDDIEIRNWANKAMPFLRSSLDNAMTCKENYKNNVTRFDIKGQDGKDSQQDQGEKDRKDKKSEKNK